ncbi:unnamed protein product [Prorocentrum cordatum]|uniref:Mei2-like C-terminal RNA recognition motif domain-containing protein n=1 Tax=Prorocentrum cordatum TaxID=2364126 RepID=A0ABN9Y1R4_9DINO|nr:unnamed protein product [Polarella glacialis]
MSRNASKTQFARMVGAESRDPHQEPHDADSRNWPDTDSEYGDYTAIKMICSTKDIQSFTTLMLRNIPVTYNVGELVQELDSSGFEGKFDFCYMPCDFVVGNSKGYAFVNFESFTVASRFQNTWHGSRRFPNHSCNRTVHVLVAHIQGREANMAMVSHTFGSIRNPNFRRHVFSKRGTERPSTGEATLADLPTTGPPAARPQLCAPPEGAGPQATPPSRPPGMFHSAYAGAPPPVQQPTLAMTLSSRPPGMLYSSCAGAQPPAQQPTTAKTPSSQPPGMPYPAFAGEQPPAPVQQSTPALWPAVRGVCCQRCGAADASGASRGAASSSSWPRRAWSRGRRAPRAWAPAGLAAAFWGRVAAR